MNPDIHRIETRSSYDYGEQAEQIWKAIQGELDEGSMRTLIHECRGCSLSNRIWQDLSQRALRFDRDKRPPQLAELLLTTQAIKVSGYASSVPEAANTPENTRSVGADLVFTTEPELEPVYRSALRKEELAPLDPSFGAPKESPFDKVASEDSSAGRLPHDDVGMSRKSFCFLTPFRIACLIALAVFVICQI